MASLYGILTVEQLDSIVNFDLTITDDGTGKRVYTDDYIEAQITQAELLVFGYIHQTFTTETITDAALFAIRELAKLYMKNQLIRDGYLNEPIYNEVEYFNTIIKDMLQVDERDGFYIEAELIDDYEYD